MRQILILLASAIFLGCGSARAGTVTDAEGGSVVWQAGIDGIEIEWSADGSFNRIYSRITHPVRFPDRQGISKAQTIAEERAKASVVRFMDQQVTTAKVNTQVDSDFEQASRTQGSDQKDKITKSNQRTMVEALLEVTTSVAAGKLKGVVVLERGYDDKKEEAWVKVGISKKTLGAASDLKNAISNGGAARVPDSGERRPAGEVQSIKKQW